MTRLVVVVDTIKRVLEAVPDLRLAVLFGSASRDAREVEAPSVSGSRWRMAPNTLLTRRLANPRSVSADPDRLARFSREARVLVSLNHPNRSHVGGSTFKATSRCNRVSLA
jgi:hypothetical protein